ncbi:M20 family metallopeptidase [Streptomyces diacarni]|uniref:M20 family metallopeptidase n=1 Tax=Streptomyces diacarni TaxID=2800381 RepID=UPI0033F0EE29
MQHSVLQCNTGEALLAELIAVPSVNPRESALPAETPLAEFVADYCRRLGMTARLDEVTDGRCNVVATLPGRRTDECVLLETHLDTVETEGMTVAPFTAQVRDGRLYGRGACDAKGPLAAFLSALARIAASGHPPERTVVLVGAIDEEHRYQGVTHLLAREAGGSAAHEGGSRIGPRPVGAVVGEPTSLCLVVAHKGVMRCRIAATGPGGHSSLPQGRVNPVETLAEVVGYLRDEVAPRLAARHEPLVGAPTLVVTQISGGSGPNVLPERCEVTIDRRTVGGEEPEQVWRALKDELEGRFSGPVEVAEPHVVDYALPAQDDGAAADFTARVGSALAAHGLDPVGVGVGHGTDASKICRTGIPSVVFGPGSMTEAHTPGEFLDLAQLEAATDVLTTLLADGTAGAAREDRG